MYTKHFAIQMPDKEHTKVEKPLHIYSEHVYEVMCIHIHSPWQPCLVQSSPAVCWHPVSKLPSPAIADRECPPTALQGPVSPRGVGGAMGGGGGGGERMSGLGGKVFKCDKGGQMGWGRGGTERLL